MSDTDGKLATKGVEEMQAQSIQARARDEGHGGRLPLLLFLARAGQVIPPWWSKERDRELDRFWKANDHISGTFYTLASKLASVPFRIEPRDPSVAAHRKLAAEYQDLLESGSEFGQGMQELATLYLQDLWTQDNGGFMEVIGGGPKDGEIKGLPVGVAALDSYRCHRTGSLEFPVQYEDTDGKLYRLHRSRVLFRSQMPSTRAEMYRVGFCWLSRAINTVQGLTDVQVYKQEKLGSRPKRAIAITKGGLDPDDLVAAFQQADLIMDAQGLSRFSKLVALGESSLPDAGLDLIDLASLPDGFDYETDVTLGMFVLALTGGFPPRWIWPASVTGATKADAMYQHVAGLTGGPGATLKMLAQMLGGPERGGALRTGTPRFLPESLRLIFDFQDDEQDRTSAEIGLTRAETREKDLLSGVISLRVAREIMVEDGEITESQFEEMELGAGRLPDGNDVLTLFNSPDEWFRDVLGLGVPEPLDVAGNDREALLAAIEAAALDAMAMASNPRNATEGSKARQALAALEKLKGLYTAASLPKQPAAKEPEQEEPEPEEAQTQEEVPGEEEAVA